MKPAAAMRFYALAVYLFLYAPIALIVLFSFNAGTYATDLRGFSLRWYGVAAANPFVMEALRNRLAKQGITVVTVKPGPTATEMTVHLPQRNLMPVRQAAELILKKSRRTGEHYLKFGHWLVFAVIKRIPSPIFRRLKL